MSQQQQQQREKKNDTRKRQNSHLLPVTMNHFEASSVQSHYEHENMASGHTSTSKPKRRIRFFALFAFFFNFTASQHDATKEITMQKILILKTQIYRFFL